MSKDKRQSHSRSRNREGKQGSFLHQLKQNTRRRVQHQKKQNDAPRDAKEEKEVTTTATATEAAASVADNGTHAVSVDGHPAELHPRDKIPSSNTNGGCTESPSLQEETKKKNVPVVESAFKIPQKEVDSVITMKKKQKEAKKKEPLDDSSSVDNLKAELKDWKERFQDLTELNDIQAQGLHKRFEQQRRDNETIAKLETEKAKVEKEKMEVEQEKESWKKRYMQVETEKDAWKQRYLQLETEKESWKKRYLLHQQLLRQFTTSAGAIEAGVDPFASSEATPVSPPVATDAERLQQNDKSYSKTKMYRAPFPGNGLESQNDADEPSLANAAPHWRADTLQVGAASMDTAEDESSPGNRLNLDESNLSLDDDKVASKVTTAAVQVPGSDAANAECFENCPANNGQVVNDMQSSSRRKLGENADATTSANPTTHNMQVEEQSSKSEFGETSLRDSPSIGKNDGSDVTEKDSGAKGYDDRTVSCKRDSNNSMNSTEIDEDLRSEFVGAKKRYTLKIAKKGDDERLGNEEFPDRDRTENGGHVSCAEKGCSSPAAEYTRSRSATNQNPIDHPVKGTEMLVEHPDSVSMHQTELNPSQTRTNKRASLDPNPNSMTPTSEKSSDKVDLWGDDDMTDESKSISSRKSCSSRRSNASDDGWMKTKAKVKRKKPQQKTMQDFLNPNTKSKSKPTKGGRTSQSATRNSSTANDDDGFDFDESPVKRRRSLSPKKKMAGDDRSRSMIQRKKQRLGSDSDNNYRDITRRVDDDNHSGADANGISSDSNGAETQQMSLDPPSQSPPVSRARQPNRVSLSASKMPPTLATRYASSPNRISDDPSSKDANEVKTLALASRNKDTSCSKKGAIPVLDARTNSAHVATSDDMSYTAARDVEVHKHHQDSYLEEGNIERTIPTAADAVNLEDTQDSSTQWEKPFPRGMPRTAPIDNRNSFNRDKKANDSPENLTTVVQAPPNGGAAFNQNNFEASLTQDMATASGKTRCGSGTFNHDTQGSETQWEPSGKRLDSAPVDESVATSSAAIDHGTQGSETQWEPRSEGDKSQLQSPMLRKEPAIDTQSSETQLPGEIIACQTTATLAEKGRDRAFQKDTSEKDTQATETQWEPSLNYTDDSNAVSESKENIPAQANEPVTPAYFTDFQKTSKPKVVFKPNNDTGWMSNKTSRAFLNEMDRRQETKRGPGVVSKEPEQQLVTRSNKASTENDSYGYDEFMERDDDSDPGYAYVESRKGKCRKGKAGEECFDCDHCRAFYDTLQHQGLEVDPVFAKANALKNSRHRGRSKRTDTPDEFWEMSFADSIQKRMQHDESDLDSYDDDASASGLEIDVTKSKNVPADKETQI